jgi:hypothetical protein
MRHVETARGQGRSLPEFLRGIEPNSRVAVTDTARVARWQSRWPSGWPSPGPAHRAEVECFSFAGPTAGNAAFAQRYNALLSTRTRRIVNRRDLVPHAWVPSELVEVEESPRALPSLERRLAEG